MKFTIAHGRWSTLRFRMVDAAMGGMIRWCVGNGDACQFVNRDAADFWNRRLDLDGVIIEVLA